MAAAKAPNSRNGTSKSSAPNGRSNPSDAIALLKADHRKVAELFASYESARGSSSKTKLAQQICLELSVHATIEEEILYPACRGAVEDGMVDEAYVEHDGAKVLIAELMAGSPEDDFYDAKVKVLSEEIKHHVKEEEGKDGIFAQAKSAQIDMTELGGRLTARKAALMAEFKENGIPTPETRSMRGAELVVGQPFE